MPVRIFAWKCRAFNSLIIICATAPAFSLVVCILARARASACVHAYVYSYRVYVTIHMPVGSSMKERRQTHIDTLER